MRRTKVAEDRVRELHMQLLKSNQELNFSQDALRKLKREYQSTRQDAEGMLQVMSGLERQVSDFSARESDLERRMKENAEGLENALTLKDQAVAREEHNRREVERLLEERKKSSLSRQHEVEEAVRAAVERCNAQVRSVETTLDALVVKNAQLQLDTELATREHRQCGDTVEKLRRSLEDERKAARSEMKSLGDKIVNISLAKEAEIRRRLEIQELNKELRVSLDALRSQVGHNTAQQKQKVKHKDAEMVSLRGELAATTKELVDKNRLLQRKFRDFEDTTSAYEEKLQAVDRKRTEDCSRLQRTITELEIALRAAEHSSSSEAQNSALLLEQVKEKNVAALRFLETRLLEERDIVTQLTQKIRYGTCYLHRLHHEYACCTLSQS